MKHLIAALLTTIAFASSASAQNFTYEIYGGYAFKDTSGLQHGTPGNDFPMAEGHALGVGAYTDLAGFEVGADFMITDRRYAGYQTGVESTSLMLNGRYPFQIANGVTGYAGLGLGVIKVEYDNSDSEKYGYYNTRADRLALECAYHWAQTKCSPKSSIKQYSKIRKSTPWNRRPRNITAFL